VKGRAYGLEFRHCCRTNLGVANAITAEKSILLSQRTDRAMRLFVFPIVPPGDVTRYAGDKEVTNCWRSIR